LLQVVEYGLGQVVVKELVPCRGRASLEVVEFPTSVLGYTTAIQSFVLLVVTVIVLDAREQPNAFVDLGDQDVTELFKVVNDVIHSETQLVIPED
jgi:hypothetical protein